MVHDQDSSEWGGEHTQLLIQPQEHLMQSVLRGKTYYNMTKTIEEKIDAILERQFDYEQKILGKSEGATDVQLDKINEKYLEKVEQWQNEIEELNEQLSASNLAQDESTDDEI